MPFPKLIAICKLAKRMPQPRFSPYFVEIAAIWQSGCRTLRLPFGESPMWQDWLKVTTVMDFVGFTELDHPLEWASAPKPADSSRPLYFRSCFDRLCSFGSGLQILTQRKSALRH